MKARAVFAWNVRRLRLERGISQERLAFDAGIDRAYMGEIERKRGNATLDLIDKIAEVLKVPLAELFKPKRIAEKSPRPLRVGRKPVGSKRKS